MLSVSSYLENISVFKERVLRILISDTRRRLARGAFWGALAAVVSNVVSLGCSFVLARILGKQGFGEYGIINSTVGMIGSVAGLGVGSTVVKYVAELKKSDPRRCGRILALSSMVTFGSAAVFGCLLGGIAPWLAEEVLAAPHLANMLRISAVTVALGLVNGVQNASLQGCEAYRVIAFVNAVSNIVRSLLVLLFAWWWGLVGAVVVMMITMGGTVIWTRLQVRAVWRKYRLQYIWRGAVAEWRVLVHYSLPMLIVMVTIWPTQWGACAFLANQSNGYAELAVFNAGGQWMMAVQFLPNLLCTAMLPVMSEKFGEGNDSQALAVMKKMMLVLIVVVVPVAGCLCLVSPWLMRGYGTGFVGCHWVLILQVLTGGVFAIMNPVSNYILANGAIWSSLWTNLIYCGTTLLGSWWLVHWGALGLSGARLLTGVIHFVLLLWLVRRLSRLARGYSVDIAKV